MKLRDLADVPSDSDVTGFALDHRKVAPGSVFGAFKGAVFNGEDFIGQAVDRGAVAVVARPEAPAAEVPVRADPEPRASENWRYSTFKGMDSLSSAVVPRADLLAPGPWAVRRCGGLL